MGSLHFLDDVHEDLVALWGFGFFLFDSAFVEMMQIFESLMELHYFVYHEEGVWVSGAAEIWVGEGVVLW